MPTDREWERAPDHIQDFIFLRELSEVYLLIDHLSGRADKSFSGAASDNALKSDLSGDWLEQICLIGWPPTDSEPKRAEQAASLLRAKDALNLLARPASGATIAFTLLVSGEDNSEASARRSRFGQLFRRISGLWRRKKDSPEEENPAARVPLVPAATPPPPPPPKGGVSEGGWGDHPPSRRSLARLAYPGLVGIARRFTLKIQIMIVLLFLWLIVTCSLSWNVATGQAIVHRLDLLHIKEASLLKDIASAAASAEKQRDEQRPLNPVSPTQNARLPDDDKTQETLALGISLFVQCDWPQLYPPAAASKSNAFNPSRLDDAVLCAQVAAERRDTAASRVNLADWLAPWRWLKGITHLICHGACLTVRSGELILPADSEDEQWSSVLLEVLANAVLPLCYGLLGAGAAVVRNLWGRMRDSLLAPRDFTLALAQLALGAVVGVAIGLFIAPSSTAAPGSNAFTGTVALTASALSFIAGFGVEGVFVALESLVRRIFNLPTEGKSN